MRKIAYTPYVLWALCLGALLILPETKVRALRYSTLAVFSPLYRGAKKEVEEIEKLKLENEILLLQIERMREYLLLEDRVEEEVSKCKLFFPDKEQSSAWREFCQRRREEFSRNLHLEMQALPAKVIFRDPLFWSSSFWINIGERDNRALCRKIVAKNSPVLVGTSLIGVIEEVLEKKSRVRLITDGCLVPSVRAVRGRVQNQYLLEHLEALLLGLRLREELFSTKEEKEAIFSSFVKIKQQLQDVAEDRYMAKGELFGTARPLWRSRGTTLKGVGFNYDYADAEGVSKDLRRGSLVAKGDLLITTGLDGVFPSGLKVAMVSDVYPIKEGGYAYELEASLTAGSLDDVVYVSVIPPLEDQ